MYKYLWTLKNRHIKGRHSTQTQNTLKSCLVDNSFEISNISFTPKDLIDTHHIMTLIMKS
jgi:hypothetical protein